MLQIYLSHALILHYTSVFFFRTVGCLEEPTLNLFFYLSCVRKKVIINVYNLTLFTCCCIFLVFYFKNMCILVSLMSLLLYLVFYFVIPGIAFGDFSHQSNFFLFQLLFFIVTWFFSGARETCAWYCSEGRIIIARFSRNCQPDIPSVAVVILELPSSTILGFSPTNGETYQKTNKM